MKINRSRKTFRVLAVVAAASAALAACSSQGGAQSQGGGSAPTASGGGDRYTFQMITHEVPGDTFWDKIRAGAQDAADRFNVELQYSNNRNAPEQATLVQNAIDSKVDGIASTLAFPEAVGPVVQKAIDAGIPTVTFNSGLEQYQQYGAKMYFGSNERLAGETAGKEITQDGGGKAICIIQEQGQIALETRCAGVKQGFANTEILNVDSADLGAVQATIGAKLQQDPSITHIVALGAPIAIAALQAQTDAGNTSAKILTFDLNTETAQAIKDGKILLAIDQQPYVQGFMSVAALWLSITNGNDIGGGGPVLTGPSVVDKSNIDTILPFAQNNRR